MFLKYWVSLFVLAVLGLRGGTSASLVADHGLRCPMVCGKLVPWPGIKSTSPSLKGGFLNTGPPGKSGKLLLVIKNCQKRKCSVVSDCDPMDCPWDFPGKNAEVGCHFLLQEILPIKGLNQGLLHCRQTLYHLSQQESQGSSVSSQQKFEVMDVKALGMSQLSDRLCYSSQLSDRPCYSSRTDQC